MKIAFLVNSFPSASETFILNQITGLIDLGHSVDIFTRHKPNLIKIHPDILKYNLLDRTFCFEVSDRKLTLIIKGIIIFITNFFKSPFKVLLTLNFIKYRKEALSFRLLCLASFFLKSSFDLVHCHFGQNGLLCAYLKEIGIIQKYITSFHGYDINIKPKIYGEKMYKDLFKNCNFYTTNSQFSKHRLIKLGCPNNKIEIIHAGVNLKKFKFNIKKLDSCEVIKILTVGRLVEEKGYEYAIKAISLIAKKYKNIHYVIVGDGYLKNKLEGIVNSLVLEKYVQFYGIAKEDEVIDLYKQAHIFILASISASNGGVEGQGLVIQEAQAMGLPVITTKVGGLPEGLSDGESGFLVPEKDAEALAEKIEYLINHQEKWAEFAHAGRKFVEKRYDISKLNEKLDYVYTRVYGTN